MVYAQKDVTFLVLWVFPSPYGEAQGLMDYVGSSTAADGENWRARWPLPVPGKPTWAQQDDEEENDFLPERSELAVKRIWVLSN